MQNYVSALLSNISYLKEGNYSINAAGKLTLFGGSESELTAAEIAFFNEHFKIEHQKNGTEGFSAMTIVAVKTSVFGGFNAGDVTVAYRGTELELDDFITDIGMAIKALDDIIPDIIVDALSVIPLIRNLRAIGNLPIWGNYFNSQTQQALNYFNDVKSAYSNLNVVGHSLGGFLANYVTVRDNNYQYINNTTTFNAPGFSIAVHSIKKVEATLENLILQDKSHLTTAEIDELNYEINILQEKIKIDQFNENSFHKLNPYFSSTGIEFTSNDLIMFSPVEKIPLFTTPQDIPIFDHKIALLMESTALYDSLNAIMKGVLVDNYKTITNMLENFHKLPLTTTTIKQITKYISTFLGFSSESSFDVFNFVSNLTSSELNNYIYKPINSSNYKDSSANLYALFNFIPFSISNSNDIFNDTDFNINKYTEQKLSEKYDLFEKYNNLSKFTLSHATLTNMSIYETYKIIYEENSSSAYVIFDERNKIIITNDSRSAASSSGIGDFSFYGDSFANIETTYLKNNQSALFVNTLKNKVYDTYLDDYIHLNKGTTTLDLSYGNDTVSIDVAAGSTIKDVSIKDDGLGDLFIFNGGGDNDIIKGTKYKDKIIGNDGDDHLFAGDDNDTINGGNGDDFIFGEDGDDTLIGDDGDDRLMGGSGSNYLYGGDGNDTLNAYNTLNEYHDIKGDHFDGGSGTNTLFGTGYGDTYIYSDGFDTIHESDTNDGLNYIDKLIFNSSIQADQISLYNILNNLVIKINGMEKIFIIDYYNNKYSYLDEIHFTNPISGYKTIWDTNYILQHTINKTDDSVQNAIYGSDGDDNINGSEKSDYIKTKNGNDIVYAGDGDDVVYVGNGNDIVYGGNGDDTIYGEFGDDKLNGDAGNDTIYGGDGEDIINGGTGDDLIYGEFSNDKLNGDAGNDTIYGGDGNDTINGGSDNDIIYGGEGSDIIDGFTGNDEIHGNSGNDTINGGTGNDIIYGDDGNDIINNGNFSKTETDIIYGGNGIDNITNSNNNTQISGGNDDDTIKTSGLNVSVNGDSGNDSIYVSSTYEGSGYLRGGIGNDTISFFSNSSSLNNYIIEGGIGNDTIRISKANETIIFNSNDGNDTIYIDGTNSTAQKDRLIINGYLKDIINYENISLFDDGKSVTLKLSDTDSISLVNFLYDQASINNLKYFEFNDGILTSQEIIEKIKHIRDTSGNNIIYDTVFNDNIELSSGDDRVYLRSGYDTLNTGIKSTYINIKSSYNTINSGSGDDIYYIEYNSINTLNLKNSNNGNDTISFGTTGKNSTVYVNINTTIHISDTSTNGTGYKFSWGNNSSLYVVASYINNQIIFNNKTIDLNEINLVGDDGDNYLSAISEKGQTIYGNYGKDTIYGSINKDIIHGGLGVDTIDGKGGDDTIYGDEGDDIISDSLGSNTIYGGDGIDTIYTGSGNDTIYGDNGDDILGGNISYGGFDRIYGGDGNDTITGSLDHSEFYGQNGNDTYLIYRGKVEDHSGSNTLIFKNTNYTAIDIRKTTSGFEIFKGDEVLVDYMGEANKIQINNPSPDGYGRYSSLVGSEINRLFELQAALTHEIENDNSSQKINELRSQMNYLWRTDTQ